VIYGFVRSILVALIGLTSLGCRLIPDDRDNNSTKAAAPNARPFIVDEIHRVRLDWPGEGWQLLDKGDKNATLSGSLLAAYDAEQGLTGNVFVAHAPQASLPVYVDDWLQRLAYLNKNILAHGKIKFQNYPAEFIDVSGIYSGQPARLRAVIFFHQSYVYRLLVRGPGEKFDQTRAQRFFESFTLLPGKVQEASDVDESGVRVGVGWRVRGGHYENAITGLSVLAPPNWHLLAGAELLEFSPDSDVVLIHDDPDASLSIRVKPQPKRRTTDGLSEHQKAHSRNLQVSLVKDVLELTLLGSRRALQLGRTDFGNLYGYGNVVQSGREVELTVGYSELYQATAPQFLQQAASRIEFLSPDSRKTLRQELLAAESAEHRVGRDLSLRNGCFHHYSKCFSWCRPEGFWELVVGNEAQRGDDRLMMMAREVQSDSLVRIYAQSREQSAPSLYQRLAKELQLQLAPPKERDVSGNVMQLSEGWVRVDHANRSVALATVDHQQIALGILVTCSSEAARCQSDWTAAIASLKLDDCRNAVEATDAGFTDLRFGLSQKLPASFRLQSHGELFGESGQRILWASAHANLTMVMLTPRNSSGDVAEFLEAIDVAARTNVPPALLRQGHTSTLDVKGERAQRTSYIGLNFRFDTLVLKHKQLLLAWILAGRTEDKLGELVSGLDWLD
jgi:hypothetical protein